jgi:hypothetical protein
MISTIFWDIKPCSLLKVNRPAFTLVSCSADPSTVKVSAIRSSETSVDFQRSTERCVPEEFSLRNIIKRIKQDDG